MLLISTTGQLTLLNWMLTSASLGDNPLSAHLFSSATTPTVSSTSGSFTECTFGSYAAKSVHRADWGSAATVGGVAQIIGPDLTWTNTGASQDVYGYWFEDGSGNLLWAELFDDTRVLATSEELTVQPIFTLGNS